MTIEKKEGEIPQKQLNPEERENLIETGVGFVDKDLKIAEGFFKKAGLTNEEIQTRIAEKEFREADLRESKRILRGENKEQIKKMYEEMIEKAKETGDEKTIKFYESALKELEKE